MSFGPLELAAYLGRKGASKTESPAVEAARAAAPVQLPYHSLSIVSGPVQLPEVARAAQVEAVSVYEAVETGVPGTEQFAAPVRVVVRPTPRPVVLVLSSHRTVEWHVELCAGAVLTAVLLSGYGRSTVSGAGTALIGTIGGFYAFKRGSAEFQHLEREVLRCTGRNIEHFQSVYAGEGFEIGGN